MSGAKNRIIKLFRSAIGHQSWNSDDDQLRLIPNVKTIFDVGANIGQTAENYRSLFPRADIWSFEPFPETFTILKQSMSDAKFHPVELAISDAVGTTKLNVGSGSVTNSLLHRESETGTSIEVQMSTIDNFRKQNQIGSIDILKIDVEGAEAKVLNGAAETFSAGLVRSVFIEVYFNPVYEGMPMMWDLDATLGNFGFKLHGLYSLCAGGDGRLSFANALYLRNGA